MVSAVRVAPTPQPGPGPGRIQSPAAPRTRGRTGWRARSHHRHHRQCTDQIASPSARSAALRRRATDAPASTPKPSFSASASAPAPADGDAKQQLPPPQQPSPPLPAVFLDNVTDQVDVLRACAALRVQCFYCYDPERHGDGSPLGSEAAKRARRRWLDTHVCAEEARMHKMEPLGMRVASFAATCRAPLGDHDDGGDGDGGDSGEGREDGGDEGIGGGVSAQHAAPPERALSTPPHCALPSRCIIRTVASSPSSSSLDALEEVVGTLDFHVGARLPGEMLEGSRPSSSPPRDASAGEDGAVDVSVATVAMFAAVAEPGGAVEAALGAARGLDGIGVEPEKRATWGEVDGSGGEGGDDEGEGYAGGGAIGGRRAYIFNVCVAHHRRRQGVAARLLRLAHFTAAGGGVDFMYVHVEKTNAAAQELYAAEGYVRESEESDWLASKLGRGARRLLVLDLRGLKSRV